MKRKSDIIKYDYVLKILFIRFALVVIGLIVVAIGIFRVFVNQSIEEYYVILLIAIPILIIERFIDYKTGISKMTGIKISRFGMYDKETIIGEDVIPIELKNINPYGDSIFEIHMVLKFSEHPTIYIYKTKDKKIISEYSDVIKDRCDLMISMRQEEILNFKLDKIGIIKNLSVAEIYRPYKSKTIR